MKWNFAWPRSASGWCLWASLVVAICIILMTWVYAAFAPMLGSGLADTFLTATLAGIGMGGGLALLGVAWLQVEKADRNDAHR